MERHLVPDVFVYTFDYVDFTAVWPVWTYEPECGPHGAAMRHAEDVSDNEACIVCLL